MSCSDESCVDIKNIEYHYCSVIVVTTLTLWWMYQCLSSDLFIDTAYNKGSMSSRLFYESLKTCFLNTTVLYATDSIFRRHYNILSAAKGLTIFSQVIDMTTPKLAFIVFNVSSTCLQDFLEIPKQTRRVISSVPW